MIVVAVLGAACGKRGAPLPPLVKLPAAPAGLTAERRGDTVNLRFTVPRVNTDQSRPANVARVDVYALSGPLTVTDEELVTKGTRVASVPVKTPQDPSDTIEPGEADDELPPLVGNGLDQGAITGVQEALPQAAPGALARTYVGVGVTARGRRGPLSERVAVPLVPAPRPPSGASVTYDERAVTLTWPATASALVPPGGAEGAPAGSPGAASTIAYHVYEIPPVPTAAASGTTPTSLPTVAAETRLTAAPVADTRYQDTRMTWGAARCYVVRAVLSLDRLTVEGEETSPVCVTLTDTFPPAAPTGLQAVAGEATISLIWDANAERDLAGYIVLRAARPGDALMPVTPEPVDQTTFSDVVQPGVSYVYAVVAVDRSGNRSPVSNRVEETGR